MVALKVFYVITLVISLDWLIKVIDCILLFGSRSPSKTIVNP